MKDAKGLKQREKENLEWKENLFFLCAKYRNTPPGFYSEEEKEKAYKELEKAKKEFEARSVFCINGGYHATAAQFAGRKRYLAEIEQNFSVKKSPVVLYGIGGIGKSALAREYVRKHQKDYDTVLFLSYNKGFLDLICDDNQLPVTNLRFTPDKYGTKNRYFKEKIKIITEIAKEYRILIIIDDCNTQGDTKMERVFALPCDILVTSRMTPAMWGNYKGIPVKELETEEEWRELIRIYQRHELSEKEQKSIQDYGSQVNGHTLLMIMKIRGADMEGSAPKDFAEDIFSRFSLKKDEKQVLRELSIMPVAGISADFYHKISKTSEKSVERLVDYLLIRREITVEGMEILSLHPLIAESARRMFKPAMSNCYTLIQGLSRQLWNAWNRTYQQNQRLEPYVFAVLSVFPKPEAWLARQMQEFVTVVWIQGYFKEAEIYCRSILESVKSYYGEIHQMTAEMCLSLAAVYYNSMNFEKANVWYWKGFEIINACSCFDVRYYFVRLLAYVKVARVCRYDGKYEKALVFIDEALRSAEKFHDLTSNRDWDPRDGDGHLQYQYILLDKAKCLLKIGDTKAARETCLQAKKEVLKMKNGYFRDNEFNGLLAEILVSEGEFEQAEIICCNAVRKAEQFRGVHSKDTLSCQEQLADVQLTMGKVKEASKGYIEIAEILMEEYPYQKEWISRVQAKINSIII